MQNFIHVLLLQGGRQPILAFMRAHHVTEGRNDEYDHVKRSSQPRNILQLLLRPMPCRRNPVSLLTHTGREEQLSGRQKSWTWLKPKGVDLNINSSIHLLSETRTSLGRPNPSLNVILLVDGGDYMGRASIFCNLFTPGSILCFTSVQNFWPVPYCP